MENEKTYHMKCIDSINKMLSMKYSIGSVEKDGLIDCFGSIVKLNRDVHIKPIPLKYKEKDYNYYCKLYKNDKKIVMNVICEYIKENFVKIHFNSQFIGDILVMYEDEDKSNPIAVGIDCGNAHVMVVSEDKGPLVIKSNRYNFLEAYTWQQQYLSQ